jgi:large subunit ribosomal protein L15
MQTNSLKRQHPNRKSIQVARGGKRGKTAGRGTKGQKARAGHRMRPEIRDLIKKLPKLRGRGANIFTSIQEKPQAVNLVDIQKAGITEVNLVTLLKAGVISRRNGRVPMVKILGTGEITSKVTVSNCTVSAAAKDKIEKAGGSIIAA